jgi:hypothetical protein
MHAPPREFHARPPAKSGRPGSARPAFAARAEVQGRHQVQRAVCADVFAVVVVVVVGYGGQSVATSPARPGPGPGPPPDCYGAEVERPCDGLRSCVVYPGPVV